MPELARVPEDRGFPRFQLGMANNRSSFAKEEPDVLVCPDLFRFQWEIPSLLIHSPFSLLLLFSQSTAP